MSDLNLPYESVPDGPIRTDLEALIAGGLVYRSAVIPDPRSSTGELMPVIVWDFYLGDGTQLPPIALVLPDDQLVALPDELRKAIRDARRAAAR